MRTISEMLIPQHIIRLTNSWDLYTPHYFHFFTVMLKTSTHTPICAETLLLFYSAQCHTLTTAFVDCYFSINYQRNKKQNNVANKQTQQTKNTNTTI